MYYMNFFVSLAKIPGGLFAVIFLKLFPNRPVFLGSAVLVIASHVIMGLTNMDKLPPEFAMVAIGTIQFAYSAGYISVAGVLLGVLLPSSSRSTFSGIICAIEGLSAFSQIVIRPYIVNVIGDSGLFFTFATIVTSCLIFMFFMMPETKGIPLEMTESEFIFNRPRKKECILRRDPKDAIKIIMDTVIISTEVI